MFGLDEKLSAIVLASLALLTFAWNYLGRWPRVRFTARASGDVTTFCVIVLNPGGQPFTVSEVRTRKGRLVQSPLVWFIGDDYRPWDAGESILLGRVLRPGEQEKFEIMVAGAGTSKARVKLKLSGPFFGPRHFDLILF